MINGETAAQNLSGKLNLYEVTASGGSRVYQADRRFILLGDHMDYLNNNSDWGEQPRNEPGLWKDDRADRRPPTKKRATGKRRPVTAMVDLARREPLVLAVADELHFCAGLQPICDFLGIRLERIDSHRDLAPLLKVCRPMAVFCELDGPGQDGCHIMKVVAEHDRTLPLMVVSTNDPNMLGAAQAVEELLHLTGMIAGEHLPEVGELVEFLSSASRKGRCLGLMPS